MNESIFSKLIHLSLVLFFKTTSKKKSNLIPLKSVKITSEIVIEIVEIWKSSFFKVPLKVYYISKLNKPLTTDLLNFDYIQFYIYFIIEFEVKYKNEVFETK